MKNNKKENYLDKIPCRNNSIAWSKNQDGIVTLEVLNKGVFNRIFQLIFKKPKISFIHLEEMGSFIWCLIDSQSDVHSIGEKVKQEFGDKAEPLYPRLVKYIEILESQKFIDFK